MKNEENEDKPTPSDLHKIDQGMAMLADILPPMWRRIYRANREAGWDETKSFQLLQTYILSQCPHGVNGTQ